MYDVAVIGGGPAGAAAGVRAAGRGLKTLLIEKKYFPRAKVCSGLIVSRAAQKAARRAFPAWPPGHLFHQNYRGFCLHVGAGPACIVDLQMPAFWRHELDRWMVEQAGKAGVEVFEGVEFVNLERCGNGYKVYCRTLQEERIFFTRRVIGADGGASRVRERIYPGLKVSYACGYQEVMQGTAELSPEYIHVFTDKAFAPYYAALHFKQEKMVFEVGAPVKDFLFVRNWGLDLMKRNFGLCIREVVFKKGCREPLLYQQLFSGRPPLGGDGVLLAGDAAGLLAPGTGEGIGFALDSGVGAVDAFCQEESDPADAYWQMLKETVFKMKEAYEGVRAIRRAAEKGDRELLGSMAGLWRFTVDRF